MRAVLKRAFVRMAFIAAVVTLGSVPIATQFVPSVTQATHSTVADNCTGAPGPCMRVH
jgi:hypothetical protein